MRMLATLIAALLALVSGASSAADIIRVRVTQFAPNYFIKDGQWTGIDVELAEAVIREAGFVPAFLDVPWSRALAYMQNGQLDMMMNLSRTPDREAYMEFIGPERISRRVLVVRRDNTALPIRDLDSLVAVAARAHVTIGIQKDAKYSETFDNRYAGDPEFAKHFEAVTHGSLLPKKTAAGRNIGFFEDDGYVAYQLRNNPEFDGLAIHPFVLSTDPVYFGISRQLDSATAGRLAAACRKLERNGALAKVRAKWGLADK